MNLDVNVILNSHSLGAVVQGLEEWIAGQPEEELVVKRRDTMRTMTITSRADVQRLPEFLANR